MTTGRKKYGQDKRKQDEEFAKEVELYRLEMEKRQQ
jgi:hypothetical protein